ncbi:hypothetical protein BMS3Bbin04_02023 [bacterium BMS3Bbin04]|nr:hypothetical protein BMS3Bbin04_02023 [bacterium BMS3Bbin04]
MFTCQLVGFHPQRQPVEIIDLEAERVLTSEPVTIGNLVYYPNVQTWKLEAASGQNDACHHTIELIYVGKGEFCSVNNSLRIKESCFREGHILRGVERGLKELDVNYHQLCPGIEQILNRLGVITARKWPACVQRRKIFVINCYDHCVATADIQRTAHQEALIVGFQFQFMQ